MLKPSFSIFILSVLLFFSCSEETSVDNLNPDTEIPEGEGEGEGDDEDNSNEEPDNPGSDENTEWKLIFEDNFEGPENSKPNQNYWESLEYNRRPNENGPDGWWDNDDVYLDGQGNLIIRVRTIDNKNNDNDSHDFSTGMIRSRGKFEQKFGKFEISCKLPEKSGWWVAFWLYADGVDTIDGSGEDGTEIDIMEGFGWTNLINHALHFDAYGAEHQSVDKQVTVDGIREGFHIFSLEWNEEEYIFYIDNEESWRTSFGGVSKVPSYIKVSGEISTLDWATGAYWANSINSEDYPDYFIIDYVKTYQKQ
ncbi:glycoside hydrolase family 16 protein [Abyssalbus ytuae]|uniref:Glycoside hydrolase family 16 protein n=1 Tax=Abyssalbus ytuae TaxID=2926907 RepID=A0A9E7D2B1_9FLAO|nr:glycoside hydrolase family 16 protein [Abyssalbus ytuae]UOB17978.1 glycoside hydrolase family 16 protein [Abyssalbus ytuae]